MLALKLCLVPSFLLLVSLAGNAFGPSVAGWLAGLPMVTGPILFVLALDHGREFTAGAASASASAVLGSIAFALVYAHAAARRPWPACAALGLLGWFAAVLFLSTLPENPWVSMLVALAALLVAPRLFPVTEPVTRTSRLSIPEMLLRMAAGVFLTFAVGIVARTLGSHWSGLLAVFPVVGMVLAVFSHRTGGAALAGATLRAMATGLYSFAAFCLALAFSLPQVPIPAAFGIAIGACFAVQVATRRHLSSARTRPTMA